MSRLETRVFQNDTYMNVSAAGGASVCGFRLFPPDFGRRFMAVYGRGGDDVVHLGSAFYFADGGDGNDILTGSHPSASLLGGRGNDKIQTSGSGTREALLGGEGDDCLFDTNHAVRGLSGGPRRDACGTPHDCEATVTNSCFID